MKQHRSQSASAAPSTAQQASPTSAGAGNAARQDALASGGRLPRSIPAVGDLDYYRLRNDDFLQRHGAEGLAPPDYYLGYGDKYVHRFTHEVGPLLSVPGQSWLVRVRAGLQVAIEDERDRDPAGFDRLEQDNQAFRSFAFDTHPEAYWDAGLIELPVADLLTIGLTPDTEDLLSWFGILQVSDIAARLAAAWGADALDIIGGHGTAEWLVEGAYKGLVAVGAGIDGLFGDGASDHLIHAAELVGAGIGSLAQGLHHGLATAVTWGAQAIDSVAGDGQTSRTTNQARAQAQQGLEVVEDIGEWAAGLWQTLTGGDRAPALES